MTAVTQLSAAWERVQRHPVLIFLPVGLSLAWIIPMSLITPRVVMPALGAGVGLLMLVALIAAPAVAGGYNAIVASAVAGRGATFEAFREGWGKYYGRIAGGAVIMALAVGIFAFRAWGGAMASGQAPAVGGFGGLVSTVVSVFSHIWLAALVTRNRGILDTTTAAWGSLTRRFQEYLPAIAVALAAMYLIPAVSPAAGVGDGGFVLRPAMAVFAVLASAAKSAVQAFARVGFFTVFIMGETKEAPLTRY